MAKKKPISKRVQAPKAVKRGGQNHPRASNGAQAKSRAAISSTMPRPSMRMRSLADDVVEVSGMEILKSISTSQGPDDWQFYLNAGNSEFFKRLSTVALGFEKYRFRRMRLRYWTSSPSSRSGTLSACILLDPLASAPESPQAYMAFARSLTRPISLDGASEEHRIVDPKWYYVAASDSTGAGTADPTTRYQGLVSWQSTQSSSSDAGLVSGYLGLEYVCELLGHRPARNLLLVAEPAVATYTGGSNADVVYDAVPSEVGTYDLQVEGAGETAESNQVPGYTNTITYSNSFLSYLGKHFVNYYFPLGASSVDGRPVEEVKGFVPRPSVSLLRSKGRWVCEVGGAVVDRIPLWVDVVTRSSVDEEKDGVLTHPIFVAQLRTADDYTLRSNTAGDVTINLLRCLPTASTATIDTTTYSLGTGALNLRRCIDVNETLRGSRYLVQVVPTGTENRAVATAGTVNYVENIGNENTYS